MSAIETTRQTWRPTSNVSIEACLVGTDNLYTMESMNEKPTCCCSCELERRGSIVISARWADKDAGTFPLLACEMGNGSSTHAISRSRHDGTSRGGKAASARPKCLPNLEAVRAAVRFAMAAGRLSQGAWRGESMIHETISSYLNTNKNQPHVDRPWFSC
jgi:hypothetical protein